MQKLPDQGRMNPTYTKSALTPGQRTKYILFSIAWLATTLYFWTWWLDPAHNIGTGRLIAVSLCIGWVYLMQLYFVVILQFARVPSSAPPAVGRFRVALIVTKTPAEPFSMARRTLEGMLSQTYPHDTWLADEDPDPQTIAWCAENNVRISSRKGREDYNQPTWPRRRRCKEGNLAYFYDHWGYDDYDIVVQFDTDHTPQPGYLEEILKPFADPKVGYVSAPSICSYNADESWAARARLHTEAAFHGILQTGFAGAMAPMCIGSHYAVRTKALKQAGGLGPELSEDHSTSMLISAKGWRGVHAIDAIAIGDGPANAADLVTQEFQWSRSLVSLLLQYSGPYLATMPFRLQFQFVFCQLWYPIFALCMATLYLLPILALVFDIRYADVTYPAFIAHSAPTILVLIGFAYAMRADRFMRPVDARILSLDKGLFLCLQWPWVLWGCIMAVLDKMTGSFVDFRVTPKGEAARRAIPKKVVNVYIVLALGCFAPVFFAHNLHAAQGFYLLSTINGLVYTLIVAAIAAQYVRENGGFRLEQLRKGGYSILTSGALAMVLMGAMAYRGTESLFALSNGLEPFHLARAEYAVSGAGTGGQEIIHFRFDPGWN
jgi:cellulose synthase (UDP-forming)